MAENKVTLKIKNIREIWNSLDRCGKMTTQYDKEGKLIKDTEVKFKFSYAISKNIGFLKPEIEALAKGDKEMQEYTNEILTSLKSHPEKYSEIRAKYKPRIDDQEKMDEETREIEFWKIEGKIIPKNILGVDLANLMLFIDGDVPQE